MTMNNLGRKGVISSYSLLKASAEEIIIFVSDLHDTERKFLVTA